MSKPYKESPALRRFLRRRFGLSRIITDILIISSVAAAVPTLNNAVMYKPKLELSIAMFLLAFALCAGPMLVFSIILRRRNRSTRLLQEAVVRALHEGLESI